MTAVKVVMVEVNGSRRPVAVLSVGQTFAVWREWFKRNHIRSDEQVVGEGESYMIVKSGETFLNYDIFTTLLDPQIADPLEAGRRVAAMAG